MADLSPRSQEFVDGARQRPVAARTTLLAGGAALMTRRRTA